MRLADALPQANDELSIRLIKAATDLALLTGAAADASLGADELASRLTEARHTARSCPILLDLAAAMKVWGAPPVDPLRQLLDRTVSALGQDLPPRN